MPEEITNTTRAGWARTALEAYVGETRNNIEAYDLSRENSDNNEEVIGDFLSDLRHLCRELGLDFDRLNETGAMHHREEVAEAVGDQVDEIMELLTPDPWGQAEAADARKRDEEAGRG